MEIRNKELKIEEKTNDKSIVCLSRHGIKEQVEILCFQAFDGRKK
jgi:hypothetical protein